jgi:glycosyltransferase involved in cell wall biosynthesis
MTAELETSIIIPMRNEAQYIGPCLQSVLANDYPKEKYEILVVDGESEDSSREIVQALAQQHPCIRLLHNPKRVVPPALNIALRQARGRYIIRMDAHSEYPPDYIRNCIAELERTGAANVGGRWITLAGAKTATARAIAALTQTRVGIGNAAYRLGKGDRSVDTVPFGAFRREIFDQVGLYREDLVRHQDFELNARIRSFGHKIFLSSKIYNLYYNVPTFGRFMRQASMNGIWNTRAWVRYPVSFCWRHAVPLMFVLALLGWLVIGAFYRPLFWAGLAGFSVYIMLAFAAAWQTAFRDWKCAPLVPPLMFAYHFVYGAASLVGLICARRAPAAEPTEAPGLSKKAA